LAEAQEDGVEVVLHCRTCDKHTAGLTRLDLEHGVLVVTLGAKDYRFTLVK
jgi:hypothetical protein